jgi:putative CocE/NonD family hydrolase
VPLADSTGRVSSAAQDLAFFRANYTKLEAMVPMRDGVSLFTVAFVPRPGSAAAAGRTAHPLLLQRTTYSCAPYGPEAWAAPRGPMKTYGREGFIFAQQDVRGRNGSEGEFEHMRPHLASKSSGAEVDESTDTFDTIEWLVNPDNLPSNNGRVGLLGISYPGFFAAAGMIDSHPALRCSSPQAPITDMWLGDDFHHNGCCFLAHTFGFLRAPSWGG